MPAQSMEDRYDEAEQREKAEREAAYDAWIDDVLDAEAQRPLVPGLSPEGELRIRVILFLIEREGYYHVDGRYYANAFDADRQRELLAARIMGKLKRIGQFASYREALEHGHRDYEFEANHPELFI